jgi:hypothetical protein
LGLPELSVSYGAMDSPFVGSFQNFSECVVCVSLFHEIAIENFSSVEKILMARDGDERRCSMQKLWHAPAGLRGKIVACLKLSRVGEATGPLVRRLICRVSAC